MLGQVLFIIGVVIGFPGVVLMIINMILEKNNRVILWSIIAITATILAYIGYIIMEM